MKHEKKIIAKMNEGQEKDVKKYTMKNISPSSFKFWFDYFEKL